MPEPFLTDRTTRQERNVELVRGLFAGENTYKPKSFKVGDRVCVCYSIGRVFKATIIGELNTVRNNGDREWRIQIDAVPDEHLAGDSEMELINHIKFAGANAPDLSGSNLELPDRIGQRGQMAEARQSTLDLRDAFLRATGRPSMDIDSAWQDSADSACVPPDKC